MSKKIDIKPRKGIKYQSEKYGCYDSMMNPYPTWDIPKEYALEYYGGRKFPVAGQTGDWEKDPPVWYIGTALKQVQFTAVYHPHPDFKIPKSADVFSESKKTAANKRPTLVLYLSPVKRNSFRINTCPASSLGCEMACLDFSGMKTPQIAQRAAIARTDHFLAHTNDFLERLYKEIISEHKKFVLTGQYPQVAVRFNGTSDLPILQKFMDFCKEFGYVLPPASELVFYDYTKYKSKATTSRESENTKWTDSKGNPYRHKVSFSLSEDRRANKNSLDAAADILIGGGNVAAVFLVPKGQKLPQIFTFTRDGKKYSFPIIDADAPTPDDIMLDKPNVVLGLRAKKRAELDTTGFAIPLNALNFDPNSPSGREYLADYEMNKEDIEIACGVSNNPVPKTKCRRQKGKEIIEIP
jgi:hypothetical protein